MKIPLFLTAALAFAAFTAQAQTSPMANPTSPNSMPGTSSPNRTTDKTMNSSTDHMGDMNGTNDGTAQSRKRMMNKGTKSKSKTNADGSMKTKM